MSKKLSFGVPTFMSPQKKVPTKHSYECCEISSGKWTHVVDITCKEFVWKFQFRLFQCPKCHKTFIRVQSHKDSGKVYSTEQIESFVRTNQFMIDNP